MWISLLVVCASGLFWFGFEHAYQTPKLLAWCLLLAALRSGSSSRGQSGFFLLCFLWPLASFFWSRHTWLFLSSAMVWLAIGMAFSLMPLSSRVRAEIRRGLAWAGMALSAYILVQVAGWDPIPFEEAFHPGGFFGNSAASAHFLLLCFCLGELKKPGAQIACRVCLLVGMAFCQSRGVWIALLVYVFLNRERLFGGVWKRLAPALCLAALGALAAFHLTDIRQGWRHVTHLREYTADFHQQPRKVEQRAPWFRGKRLSILARIILWKNSFHLLASHPVRGIGFGQFHVYYPEFARSWEDDIHMSEAYRALSSHNLLLDAAIQMGIPWLALTLWLVSTRWRRDRLPKNYCQAVGLQLFLAMFSLNFLNPAIILPLILLYGPEPAPESEQRKKAGPPILFGLILLVIFLLALADHRARAARNARDCKKIYGLFPEHQARCFYREARMREAWEAQTRAFRQDPYGPETLYNLSVIARELGRQDQAFHEIARQAFLANHGYYPHYRPLLDQVETWVAEGILSREELARAEARRQFHHRQLRNGLGGGFGGSPPATP